MAAYKLTSLLRVGYPANWGEHPLNDPLKGPGTNVPLTIDLCPAKLGQIIAALKLRFGTKGRPLVRTSG